MLALLGIWRQQHSTSFTQLQAGLSTEIAEPKLEVTMKKGEYNANAAAQNSVMQTGLGMLVEAASSIPIEPGRPVQILELGCSQGINSMQPVKAILEVLATHAPGAQAGPLQVAVAHNDLPGNDFEPLLWLIEESPDTYRPQSPASSLAVFPSIIGRSFYERILPASSVDLVFTFNTLQWLSARPTRSDTIFAHFSKQQAVQQEYARQKRSDLTKVLRHRAAEARAGAMMQAHFVVTDGTDKSTWGMNNLHHVVTDWVAAGKLSREEVAAMAIPTSLKTEEEVREVLEGMKRLWTVRRLFTRYQASALYTQVRDGSISAAEYAAVSRKHRAVAFQGYMTKQLALLRGAVEAEALTSQIYDDFEARLAAAPSEEGLVSLYLLLERTDAAPEV